MGDSIPKVFANLLRNLLFLDDHTGTHSIFCRHSGYDIMFHVSTYLPFFPKDPQQVERKRHLGNDVCVIIFKDSNKTLFDPSSIKSEFNRNFYCW